MKNLILFLARSHHNLSFAFIWKNAAAFQEKSVENIYRKKCYCRIDAVVLMALVCIWWYVSGNPTKSGGKWTIVAAAMAFCRMSMLKLKLYSEWKRKHEEGKNGNERHRDESSAGTEAEGKKVIMAIVISQATTLFYRVCLCLCTRIIEISTCIMDTISVRHLFEMVFACCYYFSFEYCGRWRCDVNVDTDGGGGDGIGIWHSHRMMPLVLKRKLRQWTLRLVSFTFSHIANIHHSAVLYNVYFIITRLWQFSKCVNVPIWTFCIGLFNSIWFSGSIFG